MLEKKNIKISVADKQLHSFTKLTLTEAINSHHFFKIVLNIEAGESPDVHSLESSRKWLGKSVSIEFGDRIFLGIATHVGLHREKGNHGVLVLSGCSRTILLESEPHLCSWTEKKLTDIIKSITDKTDLKTVINPEYSGKIEYESQYLENHFNFILRLAKQYKEWCFYDGEQLVFGKPNLPSPVKLEYGKDLIDLDISIQTLTSVSQSFSFNSSSDEVYSGKTPNAPKGLNDLGQHAFNSSLDLYKVPANNFTHIRVNSKSELDSYLSRKQQSEAAASHYITATSESYQLGVGSTVDLHTAMHVEKKEFKSKNQGTYIITHIEHIAEEGGIYSNTFTALPANISALPQPKVPFPLAQTQMAKVISNKDPKKKGRVQVQMNWQTGDMRTSWLRVMTPDGGSSDKVGSNRGFVFIPEEGDQVLIGFRYNDPNRPFVMGSLFNGNTGAGGGDNNISKSIVTRSGNTLVMNDKDGSITIADPSGNVVVMQGNGQVIIKAPNVLTLASKDINIMASNSINMHAKANKEAKEEGEGIVNVVAKKTISCETEEENIRLVSAKDMAIEGKESVNIVSDKEMSLQSTDKTSISSKEITSVAGKKNIVSGKKVEINKS